MWNWFLIFSAPSETLLCKFADGGQKKRQNQSKYTQNGRPWPREGEVSPEDNFCLAIWQQTSLRRVAKQTFITMIKLGPMEDPDLTRPKKQACINLSRMKLPEEEYRT
jgi:hypothetical protein